MDFSSLSTYADVLGILAAVTAGVSWFKARKYSKSAAQSLSIIQNYKTIETFTETNRKMDLIKTSIRSIKQGTSTKRKYDEIEGMLTDVINDVPTNYTQLIQNLKEIERTIQSYSDKNELLLNQEQYDILDKIDTVKTGTKVIVESLRQGT